MQGSFPLEGRVARCEDGGVDQPRLPPGERVRPGAGGWKGMATRTARTAFLIVGMKDNRCREAVAASLRAVPGVREVDVNLYRARAIVAHEHPCSAADLVRAVTAAGYGATAQNET
jgi:copper chaperone CopZ